MYQVAIGLVLALRHSESAFWAYWDALGIQCGFPFARAACVLAEALLNLEPAALAIMVSL